MSPESPKFLSVQTQVRAAKLTDMPCATMAILPAPGDSISAHPIVLCGSYDNKVLPLMKVLIESFKFFAAFKLCECTPQDGRPHWD